MPLKNMLEQNIDSSIVGLLKEVTKKPTAVD